MTVSRKTICRNTNTIKERELYAINPEDEGELID